MSNFGEYSTIKCELSDGVCTIWLDRAAKRNALNETALIELGQAAAHLDTLSGLRLVLIRSNSAVFCAGADLNEWSEITPGDAARLSKLGNKTFLALSGLRVPTIAVVSGAALGGGLELAMACDLRIGTDTARIGFPEPRLGNTPAWGGISRTVDAIGRSAARHLLLTGDTLDGETAYRIGLFHRLADEHSLEEDLRRLCESILACDGETLATLKSLLASPSPPITEEASLAGFTATQIAAQERKAAFLAARRST